MKILLVGYGKMGQLVGELSKHYGCEVVGIIDPMSPLHGGGADADRWGGVDVAIDFSTAESVIANAPVLARRGLPVDPSLVERDWTSLHEFNESVCAAWVQVYRDTGRHWELYELAEKLVDLEDAFRQWRFRHATTVERVIGFKRGTGGTAGVAYLRRLLDTVLFPELWRARTEL